MYSDSGLLFSVQVLVHVFIADIGNEDEDGDEGGNEAEAKNVYGINMDS